MSAPFAGEQRFGPYCGCRYVGIPGTPDESEVWLLYDGEPYPGGLPARPVIGVLYNRPQAQQDDNRSDNWIARPHGPAHKGTEYEGLTAAAAAENLWMAITPGATPATLAQASARPFTCGGGCAPAP